MPIEITVPDAYRSSVRRYCVAWVIQTTTTSFRSRAGWRARCDTIFTTAPNSIGHAYTLAWRGNWFAASLTSWPGCRLVLTSVIMNAQINTADELVVTELIFAGCYHTCTSRKGTKYFSRASSSLSTPPYCHPCSSCIGVFNELTVEQAVALLSAFVFTVSAKASDTASAHGYGCTANRN